MRSTRRKCLKLLAAGVAPAERISLVQEWRQIASATDGVVGAAALHIASGQYLSLNGQDGFPLASVCKLPIAMRVLSMVDEEKLRLDKEIEVLQRDLFPSWEGDLAGRWPEEHRFRLDELIGLLVSHSDNTAVQTLFRITGEAAGMTASFRQWQVTGIRVDRYEGQSSAASHLNMRKFLTDPRDTGTPQATAQLLARTFRGELLSAQSTARLIEVLKATTTGKARLRGLLPSETVVAHKTGTTATVNGLNGATNDVGVIMLPGDKGHLAIAVYIKGSTRDERTREAVIARMAKAAYDRWA